VKVAVSVAFRGWHAFGSSVPRTNAAEISCDAKSRDRIRWKQADFSTSRRCLSCMDTDRNRELIPKRSHRVLRSRRTGFRDHTPRSDSRKSAMIFSADESIVDLIQKSLSEPWEVERCTDPARARAALIQPGIEIVVVDDREVEESMRGWLLDQIQKWAPKAMVAYIAADHRPEVERQARRHHVQYYLSRPVDPERTVRVLQSFASLASQRGHWAPGFN